LVDHFIINPDVEGLNPASALNQKEMAEKVSFCNWPAKEA
jgi:hypothetical protein